MIVEIEPRDVLTGCRQTMGLPDNPDASIEDTLLAALLRRSAGILCPCSRTALRVALVESLQYLDEGGDTLSDRIDLIIEGLIVGGDLLELSEVATDDPAVKGTWVFAAPPSYVVRPGGSIFLTGSVPDQDTFLPPSLASRISYEGFTRLIVPKPEEDLSGELREHGLQELPENVWLKTPRPEAADDMLNAMKRRLESLPRSGTVEDLQILDPAQHVTYYRGRWTTPKIQTGTYIARRPQDYGAPIWCFVRLDNGVLDRVLDLPLRKTRWRGCDVAWHLQMAMDHCHNNPQLYRRRSMDGGIRLDFFSPLPLWSQRRLMIFGRCVAREKSLMSYILPAAEAEPEERFLRERLWLVCTDDSD